MGLRPQICTPLDLCLFISKVKRLTSVWCVNNWHSYLHDGFFFYCIESFCKLLGFLSLCTQQLWLFLRLEFILRIRWNDRLSWGLLRVLSGFNVFKAFNCRSSMDIVAEFEGDWNFFAVICPSKNSFILNFNWDVVLNDILLPILNKVAWRHHRAALESSPGKMLVLNGKLQFDVFTIFADYFEILAQELSSVYFFRWWLLP
jgi:hypothetical protein